MKNYTVEQKIQIANIISKSSPQTLPYILDIFGLKRKEYVRTLPRGIDNSIVDFLKSIDDINGKLSSVVYAAYCDYCKGREAQPLTHVEFSRQVNRALNFRSVTKRFGKTVCRVFSSRGGDYL